MQCQTAYLTADRVECADNYGFRRVINDNLEIAEVEARALVEDFLAD